MGNDKSFNQGFDAMVSLPNGKTYVTRSDQYVRYSDEDAAVIDPGYPQPIRGNWGDLPSNFEEGFDTIVKLPNGKTCITKGDQYVRYSDEGAAVIDPGYPQPIRGNWGNLPDIFEEGFDAMVSLPNGKTYVTRADQYVRYSDEDASVIDPGYPMSIRGNWGNLPDVFEEWFDAMVKLPNGKTFITKGDQYVRYSDEGAAVIDPGYPQPIRGNWGFD